MGSHMDLKRQPMGGSFPLTRQNSIYSLTFDEFQNTWVGLGKDFVSMNMDELLKNIWTAEESQVMTNNNSQNDNANSFSVGGGGEDDVVFPGGNLQRQGSFTLPRTLSQKTVDEVWRNLMKGSESGDNSSGLNVPQRQQTLGEMTLEEFLVRAGVVREDHQPIVKLNNSDGGFYGFRNNINNCSLAQNNNGLLLGRNGLLPNQAPGLALNAGVRPQQQEPLCPKQATAAYANPMNLVNGAHLSTQGARNSVVGISDAPMNNNLLQAVDLRPSVAVAAASPGSQLSPDVTPKSYLDASSSSPVPFVFGRGRKSSVAVEKVVERRQRRMIKNRESAARSRARKQAYTLELEAEVAKLKELNEELQGKQDEIMKMERNQLIEPMSRMWGCKRQCLRRTLTGPW